MKYIKSFNKLFETTVEQPKMELEKTSDIVADKLQQVLSPEEINFLKSVYTKDGKEVVAKAIDDTTNKLTNEDSNTEPPAEGDMGMSRNEIKLRQILDKIITTGAIAGLVGILPAAMVGAPFLALGLGIASLVGCTMKDAAWWKSKGHNHDIQSKYGVK